MKSSKNKIILADFGASRIKSIIVDANTKIILDYEEVASPGANSIFTPPFFTVPVDEYYTAFKETVLKLLSAYPDVGQIYLCSEMHGFALKCEDKFTPYISWQDNRVKVEDYESESEWFLNKTGMKLRAGLPYLNIKSVVQPNIKYKFYTLVDLILEKAGCKEIKTDFSLAAGTGLVDLNQKSWCRDLYPGNIEFNEINISPKQPIARLNDIEFYGGIGDLQSSVLGAGLNNCAIINLGTGSQVIRQNKNKSTEIRPYLDDYIQVITHIPSGRALNVFAKFFDSINGNKNFFWDSWNLLTVEDILNAKPNVNLNLFESAWKYTNGGSIQFDETSSNFKTILSNIARSWIEQYIEALNILDPIYQETRVKLSGGLAHKTKFLLESLNRLDSRRQYFNASQSFPEETLEGLYNLYLKNENSNNRC